MAKEKMANKDGRYRIARMKNHRIARGKKAKESESDNW